MNYELRINQQHHLCVAGKVNLTNVVEACAAGNAIIADLNSVTVDLTDLVEADSSSLAMLIEWLRTAKAQRKDIVFTNMPQFMLDLGRVCGLDAILPVDKVILSS